VRSAEVSEEASGALADSAEDAVRKEYIEDATYACA
jgi:hypothetical protein